MQPGALTASDVQSYSTRILVNGVQRYGAWNTDRELSGDLPAQVVAVSGVTQATGNIEWFREEHVATTPMQPWNPPAWFPARGDRVEIFVSDGVTEWKVFRGVIDRTTGSVGSGFKSTVIDDYDKLSAGVEHQALLRVMPPHAWDGSEPYRSVGLHPLYYVDYALRQAGFHSTPPREYDSLVFAPLQGSWWPHYSTVTSTYGNGLNAPAPWGLGRRDGGAIYAPASNPGMGVTVQMSALIAPDHSGPADFFLDYGPASADSIRLSVSSSREAVVRINNVTICSLPMGSGTVISMLAKGGTISLKTDTGASSSGAFTPSGSGLSSIRVNTGEMANIGGFQASRPSTVSHEHISTRWKPSAVLDTSSLYLSGIIDGAPAIENKTAAELLTEIGEATLSGMWIDETGVFRWVASDALRSKAPVRTVTTLQDVLSLDWEDGLLSTASKVTVSYQKPSITKSRWRNTVLAGWEGSTSQSLKSGDEVELFLEPEDGSYWIMPSFSFLEVGGTVNSWSGTNNPAYGLVGLYFSADGGTTDQNGLTCAITTSQIGLQKALVKYVAGSWPSDVEGVLSTSPVNSSIFPKNRDKSLPRMIGRGILKYTEQKVTATGAGGPGPELVHDMGVWGSRTDTTDIQDRLAAYLQAQTAKPEPAITGLGIIPDPRLQLGDVITVESDLFGVTMNTLVTSVRMSHGVDGLAMELAVRVISVNRNSTTYAQYDQTLNNDLTYAQWQALGPLPQTYTEFNNH